MKHSKGFGLVELMIVVAIIGVLAVLGMGMVNTYLGNIKLRSATEELKEAFDYARSEAIKRNDTVVLNVYANGGYLLTTWDKDDKVLTIKSKPNSTASKVVVTGEAVVKFNGAGRADMETDYTVRPMVGSCDDITCLDIHVTSYGSSRVCNPNSTNEALAC